MQRRPAEEPIAQGKLARQQKVMLSLLEDVQCSKEQLAAKSKALAEANTQLQQLNAMKEEFVANVSHELRTPLAITREGISLVLDRIPGPINEKQTKVLTTTQHSIDRLSRLINDLLDLSKLEAGRVVLQRDRVDLTGLITGVVSAFAARAKTKGVALNVEAPPHSEVYADADRITQVLTNLLDNALKFTEQGSVEIALSKQDHELVCRVADTGRGISKENLSRIFGKFEQCGRVPGSGERGTGLGLAIAKDLVELHHGTIEIASEVLRGTTLTFTLPVYTPQLALEESFRDLVETATRSEQKHMGLIVIDTERLPAPACSVGTADRPSETKQTSLEQVAQLVRDHLHQNDVVLSIEPQWVVTLAIADAHGVQAIVQRLRTVLHDWAATQGAGTILPSSVRLGAALYPVDGSDVHSLFAEATGSLNRALAAPQPTPQAGAPAGGKGSLKKRILVADDEPAFLDMTALRLQHEGYEVVLATNGEDVLQRVTAQEGPVDLILLDLNMPTLNGTQVCGQLKTNPATAAIPIIVITGVESYQVRLTDLCVELGAADGLTKPIRSAELLERIHRALGEEPLHG